MYITCGCGKRIKVDDDLQAERVKCPRCGARISQADERDTDAPQAAPPRKSKRRASVLPWILLAAGATGALAVAVAILIGMLIYFKATPAAAPAGAVVEQEKPPPTALPSTLAPEVARQKAEQFAAMTRELSDSEFSRQGTQIADALIAAKQGRVAVGPLAAKLTVMTSPQRLRAARGLGFLGDQAGEAVPALVAALKKEREPVVRKEIIKSLGKICGAGSGQPADTPAAVGALIVVLTGGTGAERDTDENRLYALQALSVIGPAARAAVPHIIPLLRDKESAARSNAALALSEVGGPGAQQAIGTLQQLAEHDVDAEVRRNAGVALSKLKMASR